MKPSRLSVATLAAVILLIDLSCAGRRSRGPETAEPGAVGYYRAAFSETGGKSRSFRLLLFASLPDRLHAEVLPPVGSPALILDTGGGRLALSVPRDRTAYVGQATESVLERIVGFPVTIEALVRLLLLGEPLPNDAMETLREPPGSRDSLPDLLEIRYGERLLRIERRRAARIGPLENGVATGTPAPGMEQLPLEDIPAQEGSWWLEPPPRRRP